MQRTQVPGKAFTTFIEEVALEAHTTEEEKVGPLLIEIAEDVHQFLTGKDSLESGPYERQCGERVNCLSHLIRHKTMHSSDPSPDVCSECGKSYARKDYLKVHLLTHATERRYACAECGRRFADSSNAKHHYHFVHGKQHPLSCPHCGKGFASRRDLRRHVLVRHDGQED
ncbi:zinc finger protein 585A [Dermacentor silvarum]|nr:zinc finger protein 585A [Dermacentor silvarum]